MTGRPRGAARYAKREPGTDSTEVPPAYNREAHARKGRTQREATAYPHTNKTLWEPDADQAYNESNRSGKKVKPGLWDQWKGKFHNDPTGDNDVESDYSHNMSEKGHRGVDSGHKSTRRKDDEYASGRHRKDPGYVDPEAQGPPPEAEEAKCANRNCNVIIYIDPETGKPYDPQPRRRPEICDHCGRPWPEGKPYSESIWRKIEERLANSRHRDVLCKDHEYIDHGVQVDERDLDGNVGPDRSKGHKRALLIGINYRDQKSELKGCKTDVYNMEKYLKSNGYREEDIDILMEQWDKYRHPTREEIIHHMEMLVKDARKGDSLFFHYSGHGGQTEIDLENKDEPDGKDEGIYPVDYKISNPRGILTDNEMHDILAKVPTGVHLTAIFDSCHSGSVLDLPYTLTNEGVKEVAPRKENDPKESGRIILWSGCDDSGTSADTKIKGRSVGAMSDAFIRANKELAREKERHRQRSRSARLDYTYDELLVKIRRILSEKYTQTPQLSSNQPLDPAVHKVYI